MSTILAGAIAGAAGTLALDVTTYADMAIRARSSSNTPAETIRRVARSGGVDIQNDHRASALGALSGYAVGVGIGMVYGLIRPRLRMLPAFVPGLVLGAAAMAAADVPAARTGATDPKTWGVSGWLADIIPHAIYGLVTAATLDTIAHD